MQSPKISIIVPIYNVEKYLNRCMKSLLNQTLKEIEIILVDDGSPDRCPQMCDEYAQNDSRIKVIHKQNEGLGYARNSGIEIASGEYVAFVDSDDFIEPDMMNHLYEDARKNRVDAVYCGFNYVEDSNIVRVKSETVTPKKYVGADIVDIFLKGMFSSDNKMNITKYEMSVWHGIYKKDVLDKYHIKFVSEREYISEDIIFHIDYLSKATSISIIPNAYYNYCLNTSSLTGKFKHDRFEKEIYLFHSIMDKLHSLELDKLIPHISSYLALKIRFVLFSYVEHKNEIEKEEILKTFEDISMNSTLSKWIYPNVHKYPFRYKMFFFLLKHRMYRLLLTIMCLKS